jgi:hypothetical protein
MTVYQEKGNLFSHTMLGIVVSLTVEDGRRLIESETVTKALIRFVSCMNDEFVWYTCTRPI